MRALPEIFRRSKHAKSNLGIDHGLYSSHAVKEVHPLWENSHIPKEAGRPVLYLQTLWPPV